MNVWDVFIEPMAKSFCVLAKKYNIPNTYLLLKLNSCFESHLFRFELNEHFYSLEVQVIVICSPEGYILVNFVGWYT